MRVKTKLNRLGRERWGDPYLNEFGTYVIPSNLLGQIIMSCSEWPTLGSDKDIEWIHASISRRNCMPTYEDLSMMHKAVFTDGFSYQVFAPPSKHINIHKYALHLWGRVDGQPQVPDFVEISGMKSI